MSAGAAGGQAAVSGEQKKSPLVPQKKVWGLSWHWWIWITIIYTNIMDGAVDDVWKLAAPLMVQNYGWSATKIMAPKAFSYWITSVMTLVTAYAYQRWLIKWKWGMAFMFWLQILGEIGQGALALLISPTRYYALYLMELPYRILATPGSYAQAVIIANWFEKRLGLAQGMTGTAGEGGTPLIWGVLSAFLIKRIGFQMTWFVASLMLLPAALLHLKFTRTWPANVGVLPWGADPAKASDYEIGTAVVEDKDRDLAGIPPAQRWGFNLREASRQRSYWLLMLTIGLSPPLWAFQYMGVGFHGRITLGLPLETIGLAITMYGIWYTFQGALLGATFDWRGWDYKYAVSWGPFGGIFLASTLMYTTRSVAGYLFAYMCVAMGSAAWTPMITAMYVDNWGPLSLGLVYGIGGRFISIFGYTIGYMLLGVIFDKVGSLYPIFFANIWTGLICFGIFILAAKPALAVYRSLRNPPPWAFAKNAEDVRKHRRIAPIYD